MNIAALAIISAIICTIGAAAIIGCAGYAIAAVLRADRRSRSQLRRSLGTMEAGR